MIYITGDTHIPIDVSKLNKTNFAEQNNMTKEDYIIICGDFGGVWDNSKEEIYWQKWLNSKNFTTLFVDGNHENFDMLNQYSISEWNGGKVHYIKENIIHLMRGQVYTINGLKFFTMGGASSVDKENRIVGRSWWKEEIPSYKEFEEGVFNLEKNNWEVDYIITHTCSSDTLEAIRTLFDFYPKPFDIVNEYLKTIELDYKVKFKHWFFGHFHEDLDIDDKHTLIYERIIKIV